MVRMSLTKADQLLLLDIAKRSIQHGVLVGKPMEVDISVYADDLTKPRATFVTLEKHNQLRGCIGMLEAVRPLVIDIAENAFSAAFRDPRFSPVTLDELSELVVYLSILTPGELMDVKNERDLLSQLQPGIDGLILQEGNRRGTFLPSVWGQISDPEKFLMHLKQKAGLPIDYWSETIQFYRYKTECIG